VTAAPKFFGIFSKPVLFWNIMTRATFPVQEESDMKSAFGLKLAGAIAMAFALVLATAPAASARSTHHHRHAYYARHNDAAARAMMLGMLGIGLAIANSHRRDYYDDDYYGDYGYPAYYYGYPAYYGHRYRYRGFRHYGHRPHFGVRHGGFANPGFRHGGFGNRGAMRGAVHGGFGRGGHGMRHR
jgi:hypothetical protein